MAAFETVAVGLRLRQVLAVSCVLSFVSVATIHQHTVPGMPCVRSFHVLYVPRDAIAFIYEFLSLWAGMCTVVVMKNYKISYW